jgi:hypothetical protein
MPKKPTFKPNNVILDATADKDVLLVTGVVDDVMTNAPPIKDKALVAQYRAANARYEKDVAAAAKKRDAAHKKLHKVAFAAAVAKHKELS